MNSSKTFTVLAGLLAGMAMAQEADSGAKVDGAAEVTQQAVGVPMEDTAKTGLGPKVSGLQKVAIPKNEPVTDGASGAAGAAPAVLGDSAIHLEKMVVKGRRPDRTEYVARMPLKRIENPQVYNTVDSKTLEEQVVTNFDDALKNVPGIDRLWESTGRGGDGASYLSMRGFSAQATMVNGLPGLTNGSLDPANIERIEVIKGPSGTLFGSSLISYGGLINTVTKKPYQGFGGKVSYMGGSFGLNRATADVNLPLGGDGKMALRVNAALHSENSFQDAGFKKSLFLAPSLAYEVNDRLSFLINTEFLESEGTNPVMLFLNRSNTVQYRDLEELNYNNKLSLTSNDLTINNPRYNLQGQMHLKLSDSWTSQTAIARGSAKSDGYYSYLWDYYKVKGQFGLLISDQNAETITSDIQQNFNADLKIAGMRNRVTLGFDYFHRNAINNSSGYVWLHNVTTQGQVDYRNPTTGDSVSPRHLSRQSVDSLLASSKRSNSNSENETYSAYISDVINLTPKISAMASLRVDYFDSEGDIKTDKDDYDQTALSPKFGLQYQPVMDQVSLFANYLNGFKNVTPSTVSDADGSNPRIKTFEAEHADQVEAGVKTNLFGNRLNSTISYYYIHVTNQVMPDPQNPRNSIQGGEVESKGLEIDLDASLLPGLNLISGYSFNEGQVIRAAPGRSFAVPGRRPDAAGPQHLFNAWATYRFSQGLLKGLGIGMGANAASELFIANSEIAGTFVLPGQVVYNSSLFYELKDIRLAVNINNVADEEYYKGWSTINPQKPRNVSAGMTYGF